METIKTMVEELYCECTERNVSCLTIVGNDKTFDVSYTADLDAIGENLYFALTRDSKLYKVVADAVRIASEAVVINEEENVEEE